MKTKICERCKCEDSLMYRVQINHGKTWFFYCKSCTEAQKTLDSYKYGGTWNGKRH